MMKIFSIATLLAIFSLMSVGVQAFEYSIESATAASTSQVASGSYTGSYGNGVAIAGNSVGAYNNSGASVSVDEGVVTTGTYSYGADGSYSYTGSAGWAGASAGAGAYQGGYGDAYGDHYELECCH